MQQSKLSRFFAAPKAANDKASPVRAKVASPVPPSSSSKLPVGETIDLSSDNEHDLNQTASSSSSSKPLCDREFQEDPVKRRKLLHLLSSGRGTEEGDAWTGNDASTSAKASTSTAKVTYTPLEKQVVAIRQQYPDCLLMVECGYRMRFFGADALVAAKVLSIYARQDHSFMVASIPTHRTFIHCQRLLTAGHKVAIVRQTETAAIRKGNKVSSGSTFERSVAGVFTEGTIIDSDDPAFDGICKSDQIPTADEQNNSDGSDNEMNEDTTEQIDNYVEDSLEDDIWIASIIEGNNGEELTAIAAVNIKAHKLWIAQIPNDAMRQSLQDHLDVLKPSEVLLSDSVSGATKRYIQARAMNTAGVTPITDVDNHSYIKRIKYYPSVNFTQSVESSLKGDLAWWTKLPALTKLALNALHSYLGEFGLQAALVNPTILEVDQSSNKDQQLENTHNYSSLDGITIRDLEIFDTLHQTTKKMKQAGKLMKSAQLGKRGDGLFALLDHCRTAYGRRTLKHWVIHPLLNIASINDRLDSIDWMVTASLQPSRAHCCQAVADICTSFPDVEKMITSLQHQRISFPRFIKLMQMCMRLSTLQFPADIMESMPTLLRDWLTSVDLSFVSQTAKEFVSKLQLGPNADSISGMFTVDTESQYASLTNLKNQKKTVENNLQEELQSIRQRLKRPTLEFTTLRSGPISQVEHLIEIPIQDEKSAPSDWMKVSSTKQLLRYHTKTIIRLQDELYRVRDEAKIASQQVWKSFISEASSKLSTVMRQAVQILANFDAVMSLSVVAKYNNYTRPIYAEINSETSIMIVNGRHPVLERIMEIQGGHFLPNDVKLGTDHSSRCCQVITGPNMGGKSSYVRMVACICLLGQIGCYVPAEYASLRIFDNILTRMGAEDDLSTGKSTFMCELIRTNSILKKSTSRSLVIIDELGRGTSTNDGQAIALATLEYMMHNLGCTTLFITHYHEISRLVDDNRFGPKCFNSHMGYVEQESSGGEKDVVFLYKVIEAAAKGSHGINVARLAGIPKHVLERAAEMSTWMANKAVVIENNNST